MNTFRYMLEQVRDLKLKNDDVPAVTSGQEAELLEDPVIVSRDHVILVLKRFKQERISQQDLYDWIHFVWFSDFYTSSDEDAECITSVINVLEELEEEGGIEPEDADYCLHALENNEIAESLFEDDL